MLFPSVYSRCVRTFQFPLLWSNTEFRQKSISNRKDTRVQEGERKIQSERKRNQIAARGTALSVY